MLTQPSFAIGTSDINLKRFVMRQEQQSLRRPRRGHHQADMILNLLGERWLGLSRSY
jgi:hypothetical protein